jgi:hypothetical protein
MGFFSIIFINLFIKNIEIYGNENLSKDYILSFFPSKKEVDSFNSKYYEKILMETDNFDFLKIENTEGETILVFVILKEKKRFNFNFLTDITPNNKYTIGLEILDRFFLKKENRMKLRFYFLNMKNLQIFFQNFKKSPFPFLIFNYINYKHPENFNFEESYLLFGFYKDKNFIPFFSSGPLFIKIEKNYEKAFRFYSGFNFLNSYQNYFLKTNFDFYSFKKVLISNLFEAKFFFKTLHFDLVPSLKFFLQLEKVPPYRIVYLGYKEMKSYDFGELKGKNYHFYEINLFYKILEKISIFSFFEMGNTFNNYEEFKIKKILKGFGIGINFSYQNPFNIFISLNQNKKYKFGIIFFNFLNNFPYN